MATKQDIRIIGDNGGGITLILAANGAPIYQHYYSDPIQAAQDIIAAEHQEYDDSWDGNELGIVAITAKTESGKIVILHGEDAYEQYKLDALHDEAEPLLRIQHDVSIDSAEHDHARQAGHCYGDCDESSSIPHVTFDTVANGGYRDIDPDRLRRVTETDSYDDWGYPVWGWRNLMELRDALNAAAAPDLG